MWRDMEEEQVNAPVSYAMHSDEHKYGPSVPSFNDPEHAAEQKGPFVAPIQIRRKFFQIQLRQMAKLGLKVDYGECVRNYFEGRWRDLRRKWTSPGGHMVQVGDSAHSFIPTSGNGATQALEDTITPATCLQLGGGSRNASLATKSIICYAMSA